MSRPLGVLIVEDSEDDAELVLRELRRGEFDPTWRRVETAEEMVAALRDSSWDLVISDYSLPTFSAPAALQIVADSGLDLPFLIVSGTIGEETAVAALKAGAHDFLLKDTLARLVPAVERELRDAASRRKRLEAERALRASEERYRSFFEQDITGDYITTVGGEILDCNPAFAATFGFASVDAAKATPIHQLYPSLDDRRRFLEQLRAQRELTGFEHELRHRDGRAVHVVENAIGIFDDDGQLVQVKGYLFDITGHKLTEQQLRQAQKMEAVGRLAGGVAHDFNNLLQVMEGVAQHLRRRCADSSDAVAAADDVSQLVRRASALTRQLLLFARRGVTHHEAVDLNQVVAEAADMLGRLVRANVAFDVQRSDGPLPIIGDHGQLEQVLVNLVVNAVDAMPAGGRLRLGTGGGQGRVWFEVGDTGSGIPEVIREKVFEPFFTTKEPSKGTGLGLAVVHGIVSQHGGAITISDVPGGGTVIRVELPAAAHAEPVLRAEADPVPAAARRERVLVVEDDDGVREALAEMLDMLGYDVTMAADADEAGRVASLGDFDLLVSDFMLPGVSGLDVAARLRQGQPDLKVIVMSGYAESEVLQRGVGDGSVRFLQKPFDLGTLARGLRAALDAE